MAGPEDNPYDNCRTCKNQGYVKTSDGEVIPCPSCNPDGVPYREADCDNF